VLAILGAPWLANRVEPRVFGLPFLLAWVSGAVLATTLVMWLIHRLDQRQETRESRSSHE
jgi:hypothetical protein